MKKILISAIIILLIGLGYTIAVNSISIGNLKLESIKDIKNASADLDNKFNTSKELSAQTYPNSIEKLDSVVKDLKIAKQQYEAKTMGDPEAKESLGVIQIEKYNIEYLWTIIGNYATKNGVTLSLDVKSTNAQDVYNLNFNLTGKYIGITDFIYSLEDDDELKFEIKDFAISSNKIIKNNSTTTNMTTALDNDKKDTGEASTKESTEDTANNTANNTQDNNTNATTTTKENDTESKGDGITLYATFTVENVGINLNE